MKDCLTLEETKKIRELLNQAGRENDIIEFYSGKSESHVKELFSAVQNILNLLKNNKE